MSDSKKGLLVILSGPSGVGKDTVINAWHEINPLVTRVVAYTTRTPREGEQQGIDYHFVSKDKFHDLAESGAFLEHKQVHGNYYATPLRDLDAMLDKDLVAVLKIDVQGAIEAMNRRPEALTIFLKPPSMEILEERIRQRGTDSEEAILRRLDTARKEIENAHLYRHVVINDEVDQVVSELEGIYRRHSLIATQQESES